MAPSLEIINDHIVQHGGSLDNITPRENNVRNAMLVITFIAPIFGSFIIWLFSERGWSYYSTWTYSRLAILWFLSVTLFGALVFYQHGITDRFTLMFAILHTQTEILINAYLLNVHFKKALEIAGVWGLVLYLNTLVQPTMGGAFFAVSILGGANDLLVALLFAYGKKWLFAIGAFFHALSGIILFANAAIWFNLIVFNALIFLALWLHVSFTIAGILRDSHIKGVEYIELPTSESEGTMHALDPTIVQHAHHGIDGAGVDPHKPPKHENPHNPLAEVRVSGKVLVFMVAVGLVGSTVVSVAIYVLA